MPARHSVKAHEAETALSDCPAEKVSGKKGHEKSLRYRPEAFSIRVGVSKPGECSRALFIYYALSIEEVLR